MTRVFYTKCKQTVKMTLGTENGEAVCTFPCLFGYFVICTRNLPWKLFLYKKSLPCCFPVLPQRRALRTASEKLRNRSSFSTNVVYNTPGTRVNRYIGRLIEARQTESEMADLHFFTLRYKQIEREQKVSEAFTKFISQIKRETTTCLLAFFPI